MRINNKGYMLVEIIIASVLATTIALYLLNLTYKFKNENEDIFHDIIYVNDKLLVTKNIMNDLGNYIVYGYKENFDNLDDSYIYQLELTIKLKETDDTEKETDDTEKETDDTEKRVLKIDKNNFIYYGKVDNGGEYIKTDVSYYQKKLDKSLNISKVTVIDTQYDAGYISIVIPISSLYTSDNYDIKLFTKMDITPVAE